MSDAKPRKILSELDDDYDDETVANSASYDADRQFINRKKKKVKPSYPPQPVKLFDICIPDFLTKTHKGENFVLYDSGQEISDRLLMFATDNNLKQLERAHIFVDGTFDIAPQLFA